MVARACLLRFSLPIAASACPASEYFPSAGLSGLHFFDAADFRWTCEICGEA